MGSGQRGKRIQGGGGQKRLSDKHIGDGREQKKTPYYLEKKMFHCFGSNSSFILNLLIPSFVFLSNVKCTKGVCFFVCFKNKMEKSFGVKVIVENSFHKTLLTPCIWAPKLFSLLGHDCMAIQLRNLAFHLSTCFHNIAT